MKELALEACTAAANAIAWLEPGEWAGFILLILEALDDEIGDLRSVLEVIANAINTRLNEGAW